MEKSASDALKAIQDEVLRLLNEDDVNVIREGLELIESMCRYGFDVRNSLETERTTRFLGRDTADHEAP